VAGENTLREALEEAWDESEETGGSPEDTEEPLRDSSQEPEPEGAPEGGEPDGDEDESSEGEEPEEPEASEEPEEADEPEPVVAKKGLEKAPNSWTPKAREHWNKIPDEVKSEIQKRELEIQQGLTRSADARKLANEFQQTVQPFEGLIRSQNSTPIQAVQNLMTTAAGLTLGTAQQKAQIISEIIQNYGVDINILDKVLVGQDVSSPNDEIAKLIDQRLAPVNQLMQQVNTARQETQAQAQQRVQQEIQDFANDPKNEFFNDVREDMADLMDLAAQRGQQMSLADAYERAVYANPKTRELAASRMNPTARSSGRPNVRKRRAASSVRGGSPSNTASGDKAPNTWRSAIEQAFDEHSE
jgi:hypothetical protein